ncbi:DNA-binding transcriptional regulator [Lentisphaerota bacterium WC36G]|nr:DNA-binding transcriptional regulator [Lentisphaerae bacterium WC36]
MKVKTKKKIALIFNQDIGYCREVLFGIQEFYLENSNWIFRNGVSDRKVLKPLLEWQPDGIIGHIFDKNLANELQKLSIPIVNTTKTIPDCSLTTIDVDHYEVGRLAANYLLQKNFADYGYFGSKLAVFSQLRLQGFSDTLRQNNYEIKTFYGNFLPRLQIEDSWVKFDKNIEQWLKSLRKPAAVLASNDTPARYLSEICQQLNIKIPDDVAILGVDNNLMECTLATPPISSIEVPAQEIGYQAAELLDKMLHDKIVSNDISLPPGQIIARRSSDILAVEDGDVATALSFIRTNINRRILVEEVCDKVGISRRQLERKFRRDIGRSIHTEIRSSQISLAKNILRENNKTIQEVSAMCGFNSTRSFTEVFKTATSMTPSEYRNKN